MKPLKRLYLYLALVILVVAMYIIGGAVLKAHRSVAVRDLPQITESGTLNIVTDYNSIGYFVSGDTVAGFQYEMIKELEKDWNMRVAIFLENGLDENIDGLLSNKYDIVARNIPVNFDLREMVAFSDPLTLNRLVLVQRKMEYNDSVPPIRRHLTMAGINIYVHRQSPAILRLNNLAHEIGDTIYIHEDDTYNEEQLVMRVAAGEIDYTIAGESAAKQMASRIPEIDVETEIGFTQMESWAVRKNSPQLLDSLNNWINEFKKTKEFKRLQRKYY